MALQRSETKCVISRLISEGSYDIILIKIFTFLDKISLISCGKVCKLWRRILSDVIRSFPKHFRFLNIQQNRRWKSHSVATFRSINLKVKFILHELIRYPVCVYRNFHFYRNFQANCQTKSAKVTLMATDRLVDIWKESAFFILCQYLAPHTWKKLLRSWKEAGSDLI